MFFCIYHQENMGGNIISYGDKLWYLFSLWPCDFSKRDTVALKARNSQSMDFWGTCARIFLNHISQLCVYFCIRLFKSEHQGILRRI